METFTVILESDEFGLDEFKYDTAEEALAGLKRLKKSARLRTKDDGVKRKVYLETV